MDYRVKRLFGTLFLTALVVLVWALITGTAHAQSRTSIFTTEQLFQGVPVAQHACLTGHAASCNVVRDITTELLDRGALQSPRTPTMDKLRVIVSFNEDCIRLGVCAYDEPILLDMFASALVSNHVAPIDFMHAMDTRYGELASLGPTFIVILLDTYANLQRARANGF